MMPAPLRRLAAALCHGASPGSPRRRLCAFLQGDGTWLQAFHAMRGVFTPEEAEELAERLTRVRPPDPDWTAESLPESEAAIAGWLEITRYLRNQLLRDSDLFSMAQGIELRVPFVDVRLADAMREPWERLHSTLTAMSEKLTDEPSSGDDDKPKKRYHETLVTNATDLCSLLTKLNITGDPKLEEARKQLELTMLGADIEAIKESPAIRESMKSKVDAILEKFDW